MSSQDPSGLKAVVDLPRLVRRILIHGGKRAMKAGNGIDIWPVEQLLQALATGRLWP